MLIPILSFCYVCIQQFLGLYRKQALVYNGLKAYLGSGNNVHSHLNFYNEVLNHIIRAIKRSDTDEALKLLKEHPKILVSTDEVSLNIRAGVLYHAIQYSCVSLVAFTLSLAPSPDIHFYRLYGSTPIALAIDKNATDLLPILYSKGNKNFALHAAVKSNQKNIIVALREHCFFPQKLIQHLGLG
jgi:hypothetical protein